MNLEFVNRNFYFCIRIVLNTTFLLFCIIILIIFFRKRHHNVLQWSSYLRECEFLVEFETRWISCSSFYSLILSSTMKYQRSTSEATDTSAYWTFAFSSLVKARLKIPPFNLYIYIWEIKIPGKCLSLDRRPKKTSPFRSLSHITGVYFIYKARTEKRRLMIWKYSVVTRFIC
jgi:hypothetical protein